MHLKISLIKMEKKENYSKQSLRDIFVGTSQSPALTAQSFGTSVARRLPGSPSKRVFNPLSTKFMPRKTFQ